MKKNMFSIFIFAVLWVAITISAHADQSGIKTNGGDVGGGGVAQLLALTPQEKDLLKQQQNVKAAFNKWLSTMDEQKEMKVLEKLYEIHVVPQLK